MIKRFFREIIVATLFIIVIIAPLSSNALTPPLVQFGGRAYMFWPCTCSGAAWLWFVPLYMGGVPVTGPLAFYPFGTFEFSYYMGGLPGIEYLGGYIPGVQACWIYAGVTCVPLPNYGVMGMIGTGL